MVEIIRNNYRNDLPLIVKIEEIKKGFSLEKKYQIITEDGEFLLRILSGKKYEQKEEEFNIIQRCYNAGVKCNEPISFWSSPTFVDI